LSCRDKSALIPKKRGIYEVKEDSDLKMKIDALTIERLMLSLLAGPSMLLVAQIINPREGGGGFLLIKIIMN